MVRRDRFGLDVDIDPLFVPLLKPCVRPSKTTCTLSACRPLGHLTLAPGLKAELAEYGRGDIMIVVGVMPESIRIHGVGNDRLSGRLRPSPVKGGIKEGQFYGSIVAPDFLMLLPSRTRRLVYPHVLSWRQLLFRIGPQPSPLGD